MMLGRWPSMALALGLAAERQCAPVDADTVALEAGMRPASAAVAVHLMMLLLMVLHSHMNAGPDSLGAVLTARAVEPGYHVSFLQIVVLVDSQQRNRVCAFEPAECFRPLGLGESHLEDIRTTDLSVGKCYNAEFLAYT